MLIVFFGNLFICFLIVVVGFIVDWEIREKDGYKIVHLQNVSKAHYVAGRLDFLNAEDAELVIR